MGNVRKRYGKKQFPYFSPASLRRARRLLAKSGLSHREFAVCIGVSLNTVRDLLYGRVAGKRGDAHRAAVALSLKKDIRNMPGLWPAASRQLRKPNAHEKRIIAILRHYRRTRRFSLLDRNGLNILPLSGAELASIHDFDPAATRRALDRYLGRADRMPVRGTMPWLIMFAASCEAGGEVCKGMAKQIQTYKEKWEKHLAG